MDRTLLCKLLGLDAEATDEQINAALAEKVKGMEPAPADEPKEKKAEGEYKEDEPAKDEEKKDEPSSAAPKLTLRSRLAALFAGADELARERAARAESQAAAQKLSSEAASIQERLAAVAKENAQLRSELADAEKFLKDREAAAKATAKSIAQSVGVPVSQLPAPAPAAAIEPKTMSRAQFDSLAPQAREAFFRNGGKLSD